MEDIFSGTIKSNTITIRIDRNIANKLNNLNKGSYNSALKHLLEINPDKKLFEKVKDLEDQILEIQDKFQRLIRLNNSLRM
ncbi:MAG: hypothetical protein IMZ51_03865 [Chloroflexi bacterium]|nr:hypothetical protein [Chloroflexota bacterium]